MSVTRQAVAKDPLMVEALGPVAPRWGWRHRGAGRAWPTAARRYQSTTVQLAGLYPFVAGSGSPANGVPIGRHMLWHEVVCLDPLQWLRDGLVTNTGIFLIGDPGVGKSALSKRLMRGMAAFGVKPMVLGDTKGEHTAVIEDLTGQVRASTEHEHGREIDDFDVARDGTVYAWGRNVFDANYAVRGFYFGLEPPDYANKLYTQRGDPRSLGVTIEWQWH